MMAITNGRGGAFQVTLPREKSFIAPFAGFQATSLLIFALLLLQSCGTQSAEMAFHAGTDNIRNQVFEVKADAPQTIVAENGTIIAIPAGAFIDEMGNSLSGNIQFQLKEANRDYEILTGGLVTQTGNDLLASGGMYMFQAFQNGKAVKINPSVGIYAYMPTDKKDPAMGLYRGNFDDSKLDWKLTSKKEGGIPRCDESKFTRKQCKKCENLVKLANKIKPAKKPKKNDYYAKRHYWENGVLYFASSGSRKTVLSQAGIDECKDYLAATEKGRDLLATVDQYKEEWKDRVGEYYSYKIDSLGWYNIDKLVKEDIITFNGKVVDDAGQPVAGATVHLYCKDKDLKVHTSTTAADGSFALQFVPGRNFMLYAYEKGRVGKGSYQLASAGQQVESVQLAQIEPEAVKSYLQDLM
ncbi:MAG: carboxypeptidase regulatory-like domain-containing protein [Bacteroidetes bacterium]|nr:carboxypeptidase regulatory-like domain-containing protein [Bacteroidota bacterium]